MEKVVLALAPLLYGRHHFPLPVSLSDIPISGLSFQIVVCKAVNFSSQEVLNPN